MLQINTNQGNASEPVFVPIKIHYYSLMDQIHIETKQHSQ